MKAAKAKSTAATAHLQAKKDSQPFFQKGANDHDLVNEQTQTPFFSTRPAIQTKLTIGQPGDKYEQEADQMADTVVQKLSEPDAPAVQKKQATVTPISTLQKQSSEENLPEQELEVVDGDERLQKKPIFESAGDADDEPDLQRKCSSCIQEEGTLQTKKAGNRKKASSLIQTKCEKCEKKEAEQSSDCKDTGKPIQMKCETCENEESIAQTKERNSASSPSSGIESSLNSSHGGGSPMDVQIRSSMEKGFGADFSGVRIHTGTKAVQMNKDLGSHAFTSGNNIFFDQGKYDPSSIGGNRLLAHELTHTIQQGASPKSIQLNEDNIESNSIQCFTPGIIQKDVDTCSESDEQGNDSEASSKETVATDPNCTPRDPKIEQPEEGQEEPDGEDSAREIEANEGGSVDERQSHAPPADENAPESEESIGEGAAEGAEQIMDPCALREQAGGEGGSVEVSGAGGAVGGSPGGGASTVDTGGGEASAELSQGNDKGGEQSKDEGQRNVEKNFLAAAVAQGAVSLAVSGGLGEEASPELRDERDVQQSSVEEARARAKETQSTVIQIVSQGANYQLPKMGRKSKSVIQNHEMVNAMASAFLSSSGDRIDGILNTGMASAAQIQSNIAGKKTLLAEQIETKKASIMAFYLGAKMNAQAKAGAVKKSIVAKHAATLAQIETTALASTLAVKQNFETKTLELQQSFDDQLVALDQAYSDGHAKLMATGSLMGKAALDFGNAKADEYEVDAVYEHEGFWDGYITYNRQMARVDAARETGRQYQEGMASQAEAQANQMMCGKTNDLELLSAMLTQGNETLNCTLLNGLDAVALQRQGARMQAQHAHDELISNIDQSLAATIAQFEEKEKSQIQLVIDYGFRQSMAIEMAADQAVASTMDGINTAVDQLIEFLSNYQATVQKNETPSMEQFIIAQAQVETEFGTAVETTQAAISVSIDTAQVSLEEGFVQAFDALTELYQQGISEGRMLESGFNSTINGLLVSASSSYTQLLTNTQLTINAEQENAAMTLAAVATGIMGLMTNTVSGVSDQFDAADASMAEGMQSTIDNDLDAKICSEAEKAAAEVQPWWKTALKILLVIVVIVVVALVIGPAVIGAVGAAASALAGSLGAGAALAGTIGAWAGPIIGGAIVGALSGAVIQVGNNLIDIAGTDRELSWDNITQGVWGAMIAGAIGGALGGLGGQFAQVLMGQAGSGLGLAVAKFGIESAFDVVGGILGDLAAGNPLTWESIVMGLAIGGAVQISMGGLSALARRGVSAPHPHGDAGVSGPRLNPDGTERTGLRSRVQDTARSIEDFQGRMMEAGQNFGNRAGFGSNAPDVASTRGGIIDANNRIKQGEFFPIRDAETTTPRPNAEADVTTPRGDDDGEITTRSDGEGETTTRSDGESNSPARSDGEEALKTEDGSQVRRTNDGEGFEAKTKDGEHTLKSDGDEPQICSRCNDLEDIYHQEMDLPDSGNQGKTFRETLDALEALKNSGQIDILEYGARVRDIQSRLHQTNPHAERQSLPTAHEDGKPLTPQELESQFWRDFHRRRAVYDTHEEMASAHLSSTYGDGNVASQVHLDVVVDGQPVRIISDNLVRLSDGTYMIADAKYSAAHQITPSNATSTYTPNQRKAYPEISGSNQPVQVTVRGTGGDAIGLRSGTIINLKPQILIVPNIHQTTSGAPIAGNLGNPFIINN